MALITSAQAFSGALSDLQTLFGTLKKYEATFSAEAKQLFQSTIISADQALKELESLPPADDTSIAGYLATGNKTMSLRAVLQQVQQAVSNFTSGAIPVPRSSKEELSRVHGLILNIKFALSSEQQLLITQLRKLCIEVETQKQDFDVIETHLDNTMRNVLQQVHGKATLDSEVLQTEMERLQGVMLAARAAGVKQLEDILALAMNSLQRLHVCDAESDDDEEDGISGGGAALGGDDFDDDDDDDPFFMPMPGAIKWAEASKFMELAKPLAPEQPADKQFMIVMEDGPEEEGNRVPAAFAADMFQAPSVSTTAESSPNAMQQLTLEDAAQPSGQEPAAPAASTAEPAEEEAEESTAAASAEVVGAAAAAEVVEAAEAVQEAAVAGGVVAEEAVADSAAAAVAPVEEEVAGTPAEAELQEAVTEPAEGAPTAAEASAAAQASVAEATAEPSVTSPRPRPAAGASAPPPVAAPETTAAATAPPAAAPRPGAPAPGQAAAGGTPETANPEKLTDFVNFLNGENPGACMFHAQMRLSPEGCTKLANFLRSSARVRALSLSHNYLGDAGLRLICEGLRENRSVTALDLPDNNITDIGAAILAEAIKDNPSLTQLQLAYNKIGDQGAIALAQVIRTSHSLKKLGLAFNNIGKVGCQALTAAISSNQSLKHMQLLPGNPVEEKDAKALAKALKRNNKFSIKQLLGLKGDA
ncbi:hypothetical protein Agub_g15049 [Astrephomene gubernaculifera]|uniref:Uncharacterized protein n=1 Tax=Astrephomene gubernaculifera TaxID=47775 RepID=A0AAD3E4X5_9CHLO|nr:hypothetical protein Agub_g15049 [Astrephomene gubernaculifera]